MNQRDGTVTNSYLIIRAHLFPSYLRTVYDNFIPNINIFLLQIPEKKSLYDGRCQLLVNAISEYFRYNYL